MLDPVAAIKAVPGGPVRGLDGQTFTGEEIYERYANEIPETPNLADVVKCHLLFQSTALFFR